MKRRNFLQSMITMPMIARSCMVGSAMLANMKSAYAAEGKTLVVIFQRGGCDGLNMVVPYGEDEYYRARPDIAIAPPNTHLDSALDLNGFFGFHPTMTGLYDIFQQGNLAILPTVHYTNGNRSHFSSQDYIESGVPNQKLSEGWLNRYLSNNPTTSDLPALSFNTLAHSLQGSSPVLAIESLDSINTDLGEAQQTILQSLYSQQVPSEDQARFLLHKHGNTVLDNLSNLEVLTESTYTPTHGAIYPNNTYGKQLKDIAHIIKSGVGLEVATVSSHGWDHHAKQGGAQGDQAIKLGDFSAGITALYKDLGSEYMSNVTILTLSEFGRTVQQNASLGTDHGNASSWFVIGEQINGGIYGDWPGLLPSQLYQNRYLAHTVNFVDVYAELLDKHLNSGDKLAQILPGSQYQSIGFLS